MQSCGSAPSVLSLTIQQTEWRCGQLLDCFLFNDEEKLEKKAKTPSALKIETSYLQDCFVCHLAGEHHEMLSHSAADEAKAGVLLNTYPPASVQV